MILHPDSSTLFFRFRQSVPVCKRPRTRGANVTFAKSLILVPRTIWLNIGYFSRFSGHCCDYGRVIWAGSARNVSAEGVGREEASLLLRSTSQSREALELSKQLPRLVSNGLSSSRSLLPGFVFERGDKGLAVIRIAR